MGLIVLINDLEKVIFTVLSLSKNFTIEYILKINKISYGDKKCELSDYE